VALPTARGRVGSIPSGKLPSPRDLPGAHRVHLTDSRPNDGPGLPKPLRLVPGRVVGLEGTAGFGMTRLGLVMLGSYPAAGPVVYLDARGWMSPLAAWEAGVDLDSLVVVRCDDPITWGRVAATLVEGVAAVVAEVPRGVKDTQLRTLAALARRRSIPLALRPIRAVLPPSLAHLRLVARSLEWTGTDAGHGRLARRRLMIEASGKAMQGHTALIELEDHGTDAVRLVSGLAAASSRRAAG
jgi:hypothetical protein